MPRNGAATPHAQELPAHLVVEAELRSDAVEMTPDLRELLDRIALALRAGPPAAKAELREFYLDCTVAGGWLAR